MAKRLNRAQIEQLAEGVSPLHIKGIGRTRDCEEIITELAQRLKRFQDRTLPDVMEELGVVIRGAHKG